MKNQIIIHRTRIGKDIVAEFTIPRTETQQKEGKVIILCPGAPSMPGKSVLLEFLAVKGFHVLLPRYRGTWESSGKFLENEPTEDIKEVIDALSQPLLSLYEGQSYSFPKKLQIFLFASSFGGPASFFLSKDKRVSKVVALSPVCDWLAPSATEPLESMNDVSKMLYGEGYRMAKKGWMKLAKGDFYNPMTAFDRIDAKKVLILHAEDDDIVGIESVERYAVVTDANLLVSKEGGHLGLSEIMSPETWKEVVKFLKKKSLAK